MKAAKVFITVLVAGFVAMGIATTSQAFHSGGVAECEGCHTMHNTIGSGKAVPLAKGVGQGAVYLLKGTDQSSTCLNCHNSADTTATGYHISTDDSKLGAGIAPVEMTPGGDFAWLKKSYTFSVRGSQTTDDGQNHGHNIVAADYSYFADTDPDRALAPGGTYPASSLACSSCHDPHGRWRRDAAGNVGTPNGLASGSDIATSATVALPTFGSGSYGSSINPTAGVSAVGVYRILAGRNYQPKSLTGGDYTFASDPPAAVSPSSYNRKETTAQTHVAYGSGMSEWCANCHGKMLENSYSSGAVNHRHPAGNSAKLTASIAANYNAYVSSGILSNTDLTKAYSTLVPFELGTSDYTVLKPLAVNTDTLDQSASTSANVMCLSCHRAHASGFPDMARYFLENEFMTVADNTNTAIYDSSTTEGKINFGKTQAEQQAAYYDRPATKFGPYARNLCNKCHAKD